MTNDIAIRDDMKQVERWENEGGRVSPLNNLWASAQRQRSLRLRGELLLQLVNRRDAEVAQRNFEVAYVRRVV